MMPARPVREAILITRRMLVLAMGAGLLAGAAEARDRPAAEPAPPLPPALAALAPLAMTDADGASTTLGAQLHARRPAVISLWATWCTPCLMEGAHLAVLRSAHPDDALDIIGVNVDRVRDEARMQRFLSGGMDSYVQLRGDADAVYRAFGGEGGLVLPRLYVFDRRGAPAAAFGAYAGNATFERIDRAVAVVLAG